MTGLFDFNQSGSPGTSYSNQPPPANVPRERQSDTMAVSFYVPERRSRGRERVSQWRWRLAVADPF
jgi:hypothetical protein